MPHPSSDAHQSSPPPFNRLIDPLRTNAPLISPETSRVFMHKPADQVSPSKISTQTETTTKNILDEACSHLIRIDERLKPVIEKHYCRVFSPEGLAEEIDPFRSLASGIISQQVGKSVCFPTSTFCPFVAIAPDSLEVHTEHNVTGFNILLNHITNTALYTRLHHEL